MTASVALNSLINLGRKAETSYVEAQMKKPCADCSVTGPVSLTESLLIYLAMSIAVQLTIHRNRGIDQVSGGLRK